MNGGNLKNFASNSLAADCRVQARSVADAQAVIQRAARIEIPAANSLDWLMPLPDRSEAGAGAYD
jgi:hypothetical protein